MTGKRLLGLAILLLTIVGAAVFTVYQTGSLDLGQFFSTRSFEPVTLRGYVSADKSALLGDPEVERILENRYRIELNYGQASATQFASEAAREVDFLWPSSQLGMDLYTAGGGPIAQSDTVFNSPLVLYSWASVVPILEREGVVQQEGETYYVDLARLVDLVNSGRTWAELGLGSLYGPVRVIAADPAKTESGAQFAALVVGALNNGVVSEEAALQARLPAVRGLFANLGRLPASERDLFAQYARQGAGSYPLIVGYENQILEFRQANERYRPQVDERMRILYPRPTVWASHPLISVSEPAKRLAVALLDPDIQRLAWTRHGFRTGLAGEIAADQQPPPITGVPATIDAVMPMPRTAVTERLIAALGQ